MIAKTIAMQNRLETGLGTEMCNLWLGPLIKQNICPTTLELNLFRCLNSTN